MASGPRKQERWNLYGTATVTYDQKSGRVTLPADWEDINRHIAKITPNPEGEYLELRNAHFYDEFVSNVRTALKDQDLACIQAILVDYVGLTADLQIDANLRVIIPKRFRDIFDNSDQAVLVAIGDFIQIWPAELYEKAQQSRREALRKGYQNIAKKLIMGVSHEEEVEVDESQH